MDCRDVPDKLSANNEKRPRGFTQSQPDNGARVLNTAAIRRHAMRYSLGMVGIGVGKEDGRYFLTERTVNIANPSNSIDWVITNAGSVGHRNHST